MHYKCDHNFKTTQRLYLLLAWEPNAAKVTKITPVVTNTGMILP